MNTADQTLCSCSACPGTGCTCGCQQATAQAAVQAGTCGAQCTCGPQCACGTQCRCAAGNPCVPA